MSTGDKSSDTKPDSLLATLALKSPLRNVGGTVPAGLFAKPEVTQQPHLDEPAPAFRYDTLDGAAATAPLTLVAKDDEAKALEALKPLKQFYIKQINDIIASIIDPDTIKALKDIIENIRDARDSGAISAALSNATGNIGAAVAKVESPEAKVERLMAEIAELQEKSNKIEREIDETIDELFAKGKLAPADYEERKRRREKGEWTSQDERNYLEKERARAIERGETEAANVLSDQVKKQDEKIEIEKEEEKKRLELRDTKKTEISGQDSSAASSRVDAPPLTPEVSIMANTSYATTSASPAETGTLSSPQRPISVAKADLAIGTSLN